MKLSKFISQVAKGNTEKNVKGEGGKSQTSVGNIRETLKVANQLSDGAIYKAIRALPVIIILLISSMCSKAQISDFTTDSVYFTQGLDINIVHIDPGTFDTLQGACANEFGFSVGDNECITFGLRTINMGQHDADFNSTLDPSGVFFDSCHWHNHIEDWNTVSLLPCTTSTVSLAGGGKVGMNLMDGGNMVYWLLSGGSLNDWLSSYGIIDYTLANHPPNDDFNGDTHMGLSAGYYDTYTPSTWGNQIVITGRPNGDYVIQCKGDFSRYFNQGINIFPDSFYVPVTISGAYPNRTISIATSYPSCCQYSSVPDPVTINAPQGNSTTISWSPSANATGYNVYRALAYQDHGWHAGDAIQLLTPTPITNTAYQYSHTSVFYYYFVEAVNCMSDPNNPVRVMLNKKLK